MKTSSAEFVAWCCRVSTRQQKTDSQKAEIERWLTFHIEIATCEYSYRAMDLHPLRVYTAIRF